MFFHVPDKAKRLWEEWNIRSCVLISLGFQVALIFLANFRKTTGRRKVRASVWSFYLLADWIAAFSVGLISSRQANDCPGNLVVSKQLAAFWAPFLLLHLGGPDVITAFSLEDNQLWIRHLLGLVIQVFAVVYVFTQSLPNDQFLIPTVLMFLVGTCKYIERTLALYKASLDNFKNSLLPKTYSGLNYAQLMEQYHVMKTSGIPVTLSSTESSHIVEQPFSSASDNIQEIRLTEREIIIEGYVFFDIFKGLIVDGMFSSYVRSQSRQFFFRRTATDAFRVMEVELNFMYDALHTKMPVVYCKIGFFFRFLCTCLLVVCFQQFIRLQPEVLSVDIIVTYVLLGGALFLDLVAFVHIVLSDWTIVSARIRVSAFLIGKRWRWRHRWCNTLSQFSFISFVARKKSFGLLKKLPHYLGIIAHYLGIKEAVDEFLYKETNRCEEYLKEFIFRELRDKALEAETTKVAKEIFSSRGDRALRDYPSTFLSVNPEEADYDESLLLWHIATELCYFHSPDHEFTKKKVFGPDDYHKAICKVISDYMLYLLVMRPALMSAVAGFAQIRFQDTCEEAKNFFRRWKSKLKAGDDRGCMLAWELLKVKTVVKPSDVKGGRSKSVLFDACILANELNMKGESKWKIMSQVWVELLSYAAGHCRPNAHAQQLHKGGELITFVWLLMAHFGLGGQFSAGARHARIVGK